MRRWLFLESLLPFSTWATSASQETLLVTHTCTHAFEVAVVAIIRLAPFATSSATPTVHPHYLCVAQTTLHCNPPLAFPLQKGGQDTVRVSAAGHLQSVANLLGVAGKDLEVSVTNKVTFTRGELFYTPLTVDQALDTR